MINLMPTETKRQIRAGRVNVILLRYIIVLACALAFLVLIAGVAHIILDNTKANAQAVINANQTKTTDADDTVAQVAALNASVSSGKQILDSEVDYSKILTSIGALVPKNVIINKLTLTSASFGTPISIQLFAKTSADLTAAQTSFTGSALFTGVTLPSISQSGGNAQYPASATMTATLNKVAL
jgi:Tfp pilus assembly protein PilN